MKTLAQFLKEDPDQNYEGDIWSDADATTFIVYHDNILYGSTSEGLPHSALASYALSGLPLNQYRDFGLFGWGDPSEFKDLKISWLYPENKQSIFKAEKEYRDKIKNAEEVGRELGLAAGRLWKESDVISFWSKDITRLGSKVLNLTASLAKELGMNLEDVKVEGSSFLDRNRMKLIDLLDLKSSSTVDNRKDYAGIKHVLTPDQKLILKQATKDKNLPPVKKAEIADSLGISVAELNSILMKSESVNESRKSSESEY